VIEIGLQCKTNALNVDLKLFTTLADHKLCGLLDTRWLCWTAWHICCAPRHNFTTSVKPISALWTWLVAVPSQW